MLNQIVLVGRLTQDPEIKELENNKLTILTLAVQRYLKNKEGEYETDFIDCNLYGSAAEITCKYCKKGDILGIKGRLETMPIADNDGNIISKATVVIAEKVTFLSSRKEEK